MFLYALLGLTLVHSDILGDTEVTLEDGERAIDRARDCCTVKDYWNLFAKLGDAKPINPYEMDVRTLVIPAACAAPPPTLEGYISFKVTEMNSLSDLAAQLLGNETLSDKFVGADEQPVGLETLECGTFIFYKSSDVVEPEEVQDDVDPGREAAAPGSSIRRWPSRQPITWRMTSSARSSHRSNTLGAIRTIESNTCVRFRESSSGRLEFRRPESSSSCRARIGYSSTSYVTIGCSVMTMVHELGHTVGLYHEHQRYDRDTYVRVTRGSMSSSSWDSNYRKRDTRKDYGSYDFTSVMHYRSRTALRARSAYSRFDSIMGRYTKMSSLDIQAYNRLLGYDAKCNSRSRSAPRSGFSDDKSSWSDVKLDCGSEGVLADNIEKYGSTCDGYCAAQGRTCSGAWEELEDSCESLLELKCGVEPEFKTNDVLCKCGPPLPESVPESVPVIALVIGGGLVIAIVAGFFLKSRKGGNDHEQLDEEDTSV